MKGFYRENNFKKRSIFSTSSVVVFVLAILFVIVFLFTPLLSQRTARSFVYPLWLGESRVFVSVNSFFISLQDKRKLVNENQSLMEVIKSLGAMEFENKILVEENIKLKQMWGQRAFEKMILAQVLRRPPATLYDTLLVDIRGSEEVLVGKSVVADGRFLIGKVSNVNGNVAVVTLFSTPGIETEVFIGTSTASVIARGVGSGNLTIRLPRETVVVVGESITLSGMSLPLSTVASIEVRSTDAFEVIRFRIPVNINTLRWVAIVVDDTEVRDIVFEVSSSTASSTDSEEI